MFGRIAAILVLLVVTGCGKPVPRGAERLPTVPVTGAVTLRGKALTGATVTFQSANGTAPATGETDTAGKFSLTTYQTADGAPPGKYAVVVAISEFGTDANGQLVPKTRPGPKPDIPARYSRPSETPLTAEVQAAGPNTFTFDLK